MSDYFISSVFGNGCPEGGEWRISKDGTATKENDWENDVVFRYPHSDADYNEQEPPEPVRREYERLIGYVQGSEQPEPFNLVEAMAEEGGFDQPCMFGCRVENHAVYCHNTSWLYAPSKCRRTWYTGGETRDEDCKGFKPNPHYVAPPPASPAQ